MDEKELLEIIDEATKDIFTVEKWGVESIMARERSNKADWLSH
jgi:hypothetical protein